MKILIILCLVLLTGCYNQRKATVQHGKAVATFPIIGADYCARTYPARDSLIKGDTVLNFDTIYVAGETYLDTVRIGDTIRITRTVQLPGTIIKERYYIHDTVIKVNTAAVDQCAILRDQAINIATDKTKEAAKLKKSSNKWRMIAIGLMIVVGLGLFFKARTMFTKK